MRRFNYKAKDQKGNTVGGQVEAETIQVAARLLRERGLIVFSLTPKRPGIRDLWVKVTGRVGLADLAVFTRQFSTMVAAGLPITDALIILKNQAKPAFRPVLEAMLADVEGGSSLAQALAKHPRVFSTVYIALIRAGEEGGVLDQILQRLAQNLEAQREFTAKVKAALIYPVIVVVGMVAVAAVMMIFVIPKLLALFADFGADLPTPTKVLIAVSSFSAAYWWLLATALAAAAFLAWSYSKSQQGRMKIDQAKLALPILGPLQRQVVLAELTRTLGLLSGAGVSILEGLQIVADVVGNVVIAAAVKKSAVQVEQGFSLAYAFSQNPEVFPPILFQMLAVGEETGKVDEALAKVAAVFEQESEYTVRGLTAAVEPLVMIILGLGVGFLVIAVILPIYNLTAQF